MSDADKKEVDEAIWRAIGSLRILRGSAPSPAGVDKIIAGLEAASKKLS